MRTYHMRYRFRHPKTEDFIKVANEVSGQDLRWFFDKFFFSPKDFDCGLASVDSRLKPERYKGIVDDLPTKNSGQKKILWK